MGADRLTAEQEEYRRKLREKWETPQEQSVLPKVVKSEQPTRRAGVMNKTEAAYARYLDEEKRLGMILDWRFEAVKLKLAEGRCFYTPDFLVIVANGVVEFREVKGFWRDDARVKIKVAASLFPWFTFKAVTRDGARWQEEHFWQ